MFLGGPLRSVDHNSRIGVFDAVKKIRPPSKWKKDIMAKITIAKIDNLLELIDDSVPIGNPE